MVALLCKQRLLLWSLSRNFEGKRSTGIEHRLLQWWWYLVGNTKVREGWWQWSQKQRARGSQGGTGRKKQNKPKKVQESKLQWTLRTNRGDPRGDKFKGKGVQENWQVFLNPIKSNKKPIWHSQRFFCNLAILQLKIKKKGRAQEHRVIIRKVKAENQVQLAKDIQKG